MDVEFVQKLLKAVDIRKFIPCVRGSIPKYYGLMTLEVCSKNLFSYIPSWESF